MKRSMYKTALWNGNGEYVALLKYHAYGDFYTIRTIDGEVYSAQAAELSEFVL